MKRILILGLVLTMLCAMLTFTPASAATIIDSGTCGAQGKGDNVKWTFDQDGTLMISGNGEMKGELGEDWYEYPWDIYKNDIKKVVINSGLTLISTAAFQNCENLTTVIIPDTVQIVGDYAFDYCTKLSNITMSNNIEAISSHSFSETAYENDPNNWENDVLYINKCLLKAKDTISGTYAVKDGTKTIAGMAFFACDKLTGINMPNSIVSIGSSSFLRCSSLNSIKLSDNIKSIGSDAFYNTGFYNNSNNWSNDLLYLGKYLLAANKNFNMSNLTIKSGTTVIADSIFIVERYGPTYSGSGANLQSVVIPSSVTHIGNAAFEQCINLKSVSLSNGLQYIGNRAFAECSQLNNINIPSSVTYLGFNAFEACEKLSVINVPSSVNYIGDQAFYRCSDLKEINVETNNKNYSSENGALFDKNKTILIKFPEGKNILEYTITDSVNYISDNAFYNCKNLENINLPKNLEYIGYEVFAYCENLKTIIIPNAIEKINMYTFSDCKNLKDIFIPSSVTSIDIDAFYGCESLTDVYYGGSKENWEKVTVDYGNDSLLNATIHYNSSMPGETKPTPTPTAKPTPTPTAKPTPTPTQKPTPTQRPTPVPTAKPTADPNAPSIEITEVSDYLVTAKVNNYDDFEAQVILAVYNKNGALIEMQNYYAWDEVWFFSTNLQNTNIKVMLWSDMDSAKPLAEPAEMSL